MPLQGDSGDKAIILGGDNTGHCDKSSYTYENCLILNGYRYTAVCIYKHKIIVIIIIIIIIIT